ncbi:MAG TPA: glycolate oxidase subunit GlcF [Steroidobacteraceae bacterium]|nr:glycolate oxidase subunit GlcF [Steroidobacteraceae bacterium]
METRLAAGIRETPAGAKADEILRACVHCGFCLATCPTYQLLGDELDSPRGRIYQIKQVLEGVPPTRQTQLHLDRCLTCRSCETTCPSGVEYGHLVDIGRAAVDERVERPWRERVYRWLLREGVTRPWLFGTALKLARSVRWALPPSLRAKVGAARPAGALPTRVHPRKVLLLNNCVQPSMSPSIDAATARVLDAIGVQSIIAAGSGCCGAIRQHLDDQSGARHAFRRNIDAWWPLIESAEVEAILINASGCGAMVAEYADLLRDDPAYAQKAKRVVELSRDLAEFLPQAIAEAGIGAPAARRVAFHPPCTLQHGLKIRGKVEALLVALGADLVPVRDTHLCCGSAGTYSLLQPQLSQTLRARKLETLLENRPQAVLSANIGCIAHLQSATETPVRHWIEWVDEALRPRAPP